MPQVVIFHLPGFSFNSQDFKYARPQRDRPSEATVVATTHLDFLVEVPLKQVQELMTKQSLEATRAG